MSSGKAWLEYLCEQWGISAVILKKRLQAANRETPFVTPGTISSHFTEPKVPRPEFQALARAALAELDNASVRWSDSVHSYDAFCTRGRAIMAPMRLSYPETNPLITGRYIGDFFIIRQPLRGAAVVDYMAMKTMAQAGVYSAVWHIKERDDRNAGFYQIYEGYAHLVHQQLNVYVARVSEHKNIQTANLFAARNRNNDTAVMVGDAQGCCSYDGAPVAKRVYILRAPHFMPSPEAALNVASAVEAEINKEGGMGGMKFPEAHAAQGMISDVPPHILAILGK